MGGSIAVVVRDTSGNLHKQGRWTNALSTCFNDLRFFQGDPTILKQYLEVKSAYGPWPYLAPFGYGLILADCQSKTLLDWQGYTSNLGGKFFQFAFWSPHRRDNDNYIEDRNQARAFIDAGLALHVLIGTHGTTQKKKIPVQTLAEIDELADRFSDLDGNEYFYALVCDIAPWVHIRYPQTPQGLQEMRFKILELGFSLNNEEDKLWDEFLKDLLE